MPFTTHTERLRTLEKPSEALAIPGNRCWIIYREYKRRWAESRRWTTADAIKMEFLQNPEESAFLSDLYNKTPLVGWNEFCNAASLAWDVFFAMEVLPYEMEKKAENGDVE